jgi:hypothetical protein
MFPAKLLGKTADEQVETLAKLLSHLKGRSSTPSPEREFQAAVNRYTAGGGGGSGALNLNPGTALNLETGKTQAMKKGGSVSSASKRADGCATKGKTKGKMC